jgi:hypothetical protein
VKRGCSHPKPISKLRFLNVFITLSLLVSNFITVPNFVTNPPTQIIEIWEALIFEIDL